MRLRWKWKWRGCLREKRMWSSELIACLNATVKECKTGMFSLLSHVDRKRGTALFLQ